MHVLEHVLSRDSFPFRRSGNNDSINMSDVASGGMSGLKFPEALTRSPRCFIALSGLDVLNNAVHRAVWDEFTTGGRRTERKPILYKNVPADHLYPKCCVHVREPLVRLCWCACMMVDESWYSK